MNSPGTSIQIWGDWDDEQAESDKKIGARSTKFFKVKGSKTQIRVLPPKHPLKSPYIPTYQHFVELIPGVPESNVVYNCPIRMKAHGYCPLCVMANKKRATGREADRERSIKLSAKLRLYANVIDRNDEDAGAQVYPFGSMVYDELKAERETAGNFTHPVTGFDIQIMKEGEGKGTKYKVRTSKKPSPIFDDAKKLAALGENLPDLLQHAYVPTRDEIDKMIEAAENATGGEGSGAQEPSKSGRSAGGRGRANDGFDDDSIATTGESVGGADADFSSSDDDWK